MSEPVDVLVVGAGPTGLTLAAQLHAYGASVRIIDKNPDRVKESRALAVQPRTLEVLRGFGLAAELVRRGNPAVRLRIHAGPRTVRTDLFDIGLDDTEYPFLLFVSQAETEAVLADHLAANGVQVERRVRLERLATSGGGCTAHVRDHDDAVRAVRTSYVVGCDGAHSSVRDLAGIPFVGGGYPQTFLLADLEVDGLEPGTINAFISDSGPMFFFPLGRPAPWRLITMRPSTDDGSTTSAAEVGLDELQALVRSATSGTVRLHDPVWASAFRLHHRHVERYREGRVLLAGDAAHIHSPAGAQGMNTGIQDAINLGWKLGLVCQGRCPESLLDSYDAERRPVGDFVLAFTDRAFTAATSDQEVVRLVRKHVVPRLLPLVLRFRKGRARAFRTVSQLDVRYRSSPAVQPTDRGGRRPRAGDRLPDAALLDGRRRSRLHELVSGPAFHVLIAGGGPLWQDRPDPLVQVHRLGDASGMLHDRTGKLRRRLRPRLGEVFVVRPDGHIGYRGDVSGAYRYLRRMLVGRPDQIPSGPGTG